MAALSLARFSLLPLAYAPHPITRPSHICIRSRAAAFLSLSQLYHHVWLPTVRLLLGFAPYPATTISTEPITGFESNDDDDGNDSKPRRWRQRLRPLLFVTAGVLLDRTPGTLRLLKIGQDLEQQPAKQAAFVPPPLLVALRDLRAALPALPAAHVTSVREECHAILRALDSR